MTKSIATSQNLEQQNHVTDEQLRSQLRTQNISYDEFRG